MLPLSEYSYIFLIHLRLDERFCKADNAIVLIWKGPKTFPQDTKPDGVGDVWFFLFKFAYRDQYRSTKKSKSRLPGSTRRRDLIFARQIYST